MNQNLQDAPDLPPRLPMNVYGISLARWHYEGFYYGPNREAIPDEIAAMADEQQASIALKNYLSRETQRQYEMTEAAAAEAAQELEAAQEAEERELKQLEVEIERRAQSRAAEIIAAAQQTSEQTSDPVDDSDENPEDGENPPSEAVTETPQEKLGEILSTCTTRLQLEAQLNTVPWQHINHAVEMIDKTPGKKSENIAILAEHLELT